MPWRVVQTKGSSESQRKGSKEPEAERLIGEYNWRSEQGALWSYCETDKQCEHEGCCQDVIRELVESGLAKAVIGPDAELPSEKQN